MVLNVQRNNLFFLYVMELCAGFARGSYLVCIGWTTLIISGSVATVGQVFIVSMIANMFAGPFVGILVDRYNRKSLVIVAHLGITVTLAALGLALYFDSSMSIFWFFVTVIFVNTFRLIYQGSHDGLIHANASTEELVHAVARFRGVHLLATAIGTVIAGILIESFLPSAGFLFSALTSICLIVVVIFIKGVITKNNATGLKGFFHDFSEGLTLFRNNSILRSLTIIAGIALPIGQLSNAILSSFIRDDLGGNSSDFGFVDAAWPVGGMIAAAILSLKLRALSAKNMEYVFALMVGIITILFSFITAIIPLAIVHAALGFSVWMCRIMIDGRILQTCTVETVGRSKVYIDMMF
ncbi:MAG: MFS transporter, partial [Rhizobiales bacterium]|nr:MFS transporter [Hyphomicrobiales bacterium]